MPYQLPSHPTLVCHDPLGLCSDVDTVTVWNVVTTAIAAAAEHDSPSKVLPDLIENLVYSLHGNGNLDVRGLRQFLECSYPHSRDLCSNIFAAALSLPDLFPTHNLPYLTEQNPRISLSYQQIHAILAHQLLGTLSPPVGGYGPPTFVCWYTEHNPHPMAVQGYLATLFDYFANPISPASSHIQFYLCHWTEDDIWSNCDVPIHLSLKSISEESEPSDVSVQPSPAVVIPSNLHPGFGPSGTQEERLFSSSLYLCPIVLFCPSLPSNAALVTSPIPVHAAWAGHNRTARLTLLFPPSSRPSRNYILMDALELDIHDHPNTGLPDLANSNVERELRKAYAGCIGLRTMYPYNTPLIECGAWGCGAFGGNPVVKGIILAMAGSRAGVEIVMVLLEDRYEELKLIKKAVDAELPVGHIMSVAKSGAAQKCQDGDAFIRLLLEM
jgi:poly(ADP-ribose) glycohydrolase